MNELKFKNIIYKYSEKQYLLYQSCTTEKIQTLYLYHCFEIKEYLYSFLKINNQVNSGIYKTLDGYNDDIWEKYDLPIINDYKDNMKVLYNKTDKKPTHIMSIYNPDCKDLTIEFVYDNLLIDDDDVIISEIADEWYYEMGGQRPIPRVIPQGYHSEIRTKPVYKYDEQGRVKSITNEMYTEIVKDYEHAEKD